jgi:hypothetical protein
MYLLLIIWILPFCSAAIFRFHFRNLQGDNDTIDSLVLHYDDMPSITSTHQREGRDHHVEAYTEHPERIKGIELRSGDVKFWPDVPFDHLIPSDDVTNIVLCYDPDVHVKKPARPLKPAKQKSSARGEPSVPLERGWVKVERGKSASDGARNKVVTGRRPPNRAKGQD